MPALPKTRRRFFFYLSVLFFLVLAPFLVLYSLGYTFDVQRMIVEETGGIFVKTNRVGFTVSANNGAVQKSSFLTRGLLLGNLTPGQYRLRIEKEGYQPWEKVVSVTQLSVREIRNIILLPSPLIKENVALWGTEENPERIFVSPEKQYTAIALQNNTAAKRSLLFFNTVSKKIIARFPLITPPEEIAWNAAENKALLRIAGQKTKYVFVTLSDTPRQTSIFEKQTIISEDTKHRLAQTEIKKIRFGNAANDFVVLTNTGTLLSWNTATTSAAVLAKEVEEFEMLGEDIFFIAKNGFAARQSLGNPAATINLGRKGYTPSGAPIEIVRSQNGDMFFKDGAGGLFFSSRENTEEFQLIETGVRNIALDNEEGKLFFMKQNAIGVFYLKDNSYQPFEKRGDKSILLGSRDTIFLDADWYTEDNAHIILNTSGGVFLLDVDTRGGPKIAELDPKPAKKIFWDQNGKKLYLIRDTGIETLAVE